MRPLIIKKNISIITNCENIKYNADPMDIMKLLKHNWQLYIQKIIQK